MNKIEISSVAQGSTGFLTCDKVHDVFSTCCRSQTFVDPMTHSFSCIDGRGEEDSLGTPGGDMGEFLIALAIYHRHKSVLYKAETNVRQFFERYLKRVHGDKPFYMHTAQASVDALAAVLNISSDEVLYPKTRELQDTLLTYLVQPQYMGCGHIGFMLSFPDEYLIPSNLVQEAVQIYYKILWGYDETYAAMGKMHYVVLQGCHEEMGILDVSTEIDILPKWKCSQADEPMPLFPLLTPTIKSATTSTQFFVVHTKAASLFRYKVVWFIKEELKAILPEMKKRLVKLDADRLAQKMLMLTAGRLAPTLSIYQAKICQCKENTDA